jgi:hypothetical protein
MSDTKVTVEGAGQVAVVSESIVKSEGFKRQAEHLPVDQKTKREVDQAVMKQLQCENQELKEALYELMKEHEVPYSDYYKGLLK